MDNKKHQPDIKFLCEKCQFKCVKKGDYTRHNLTDKHKRLTTIQVPLNTPQKFMCSCGKEYNFMSGLCKHKKKCVAVLISLENDKKDECILKLIKDNQDFKELILKQNEDFKEQTRMLVELCKEKSVVVNTNTVNNNNKFNLNVFLNEKCKNAMNIMDFVKLIKIDFGDLEKVGKLGFVEGISQLMIKELKCIDIYKRPIHCCDLKREIIYVRDEDKWEKDSDDKIKIKSAIRNVAHKNVLMINKWNQKYPESSNIVSVKNDEFNNIVISSMGGTIQHETDQFHNKIIKNVAKEFTINKDY